ncbi:MAG: FtsK/SpoIIIE domain-containing protein [Phycisphaerales bacterium]
MTTEPVERPVSERVRAALAEIRTLLIWRAEREQAVTAELAQAESTARAAHEQALATSVQARVSALAAAEEQHERTVTEARARHEADSATIQRTYEIEKSSTKERAEFTLAKAQRQTEEAVWMADSLYDSNRHKPRLAFEAQMKERDALLAQATVIEAQATQMLLDTRCGSMPAATAPESAPDGSALPAAEHATALKEAVEGCTAALRDLDGLVLPRLGGGAMMAVWAVLGAVAGGGFAYLLYGARSAPESATIPILIGASVGLVLGAALGAILLSQARRVSQAAAQRVAERLATARALGQRWQDDAGAARAAQEQTDESTHVRETTAARDQLAKVKGELNTSIADAQTRMRSRRDNERTRVMEALKTSEREAGANAQAEREGAEHAATMASENTERELRRAMAAAQSTHDTAFARLREEWVRRMSEAGAELRAVAGATEEAFPAWADARWDREATATDPRGYSSPREHGPGPGGVGGAFPLGRARIEPRTFPGGMPGDERLTVPTCAADVAFDAPATIELPRRASLLIQTGGEGRAAAVAVLQNTMLRLLTALPAGKCRFTIIDPVGLGQNFAGFMHLADYDPLLVTDKIWTEPRHIEARLTDLTEHMETVIQKYLRNQFASIEEYNVHAGEIAEPYRFLVMADLPTNLTEIGAKRLASIVASGARCGVYTLIGMDTRQRMPQGLSAQDLERGAQAGGVRLVWKRREGAGESDGAGLVWEDADFGPLPLSLDAPPDEARANAIIHMVGRASKDTGRVRVPFATIAPAPERLWSLSSRTDFHVAVGRAGATKLQEITLGRGTAQHALIAGRTGSGKSTLLHAIITNTAMWYSPDEVEMYLVDFKKGVEFKTYASNQTPHARVVAIESEREFGLSVLRKLDAELKRRGALYRDEGVQDLAGFRGAQPGVRMPRLLLLVDEFQELFVEDDKLAQEAGLLLDRLVRQGRAFGMHVVLGSQTLGGAYSLAKATIGQMAVRIALACSEADAYLIMSDDNSAPRLLSRPGEAIYNDQSGAVEGNSPFQVAWLPDEERDRCLALVRDRQAAAGAGMEGDGVVEPTIVFEGSVPANIERNYLLNELLNRAQWPASAGAPAAWLGEAIAIKDPTGALFKRQAASNLLIVGQQDEPATAMLSAAMVALAAQRAPGATVAAGGAEVNGGLFVVLDGTPADSVLSGYLARVAGTLPHGVRLVEYRQVEQAMGDLSAELDRRQQMEGEGRDTGGLPPVYMVISGLQRFRALRRSEDEFDFSSSTDEKSARADKQFQRLLREGPALGLHTITWCDTVGNLNRTLDRQGLREFDGRVLFQMSQADSSALIDAATAGTIGQNRALFYSEEQGLIEKFRPWALPEEAWIERVRRAMRRDGQGVRVP